ncbi:MAG: hypothetical protein WC829_20050 [Hyphomicrobium sp.]|jgi:hypothetical protein
MDFLQLPGDELVKLSDDDLGLWLVTSWLAFHADKAGIARSAISEEWATAIITASVDMDSDSVENASLESMFRKACAGDLPAAGRMLRAYLFAGARAMVGDKYADIGIKHTMGRKKSGDNSTAARRAIAADWQARCVPRALGLLAAGRSPCELAGILAPQFAKTPTSIRTALKKAGVIKQKRK